MRVANMNESYRWIMNMSYSIQTGKEVTMTYLVRIFATRLLTESSNFMSYFFALSIITVCGYLIFYNKKKVMISDR